MTSECYLTFVSINLLFSFVQAETFSTSITHNVKEGKQELFLNSITAENEDEYLAETITPYWNLTYDKQLEMKQNSCSAIIDMMVKSSRKLKNLMTYKILPVFPSPVTGAYRNNEDFHIGCGVDGNPKTVGCLLGKLSLGSALCIRPTKIVTIKESHRRVAQVFEDFIRLYPLPGTVNPNGVGNWKGINIKSNEAGEVMASVIVQSQGYAYKMIQNQQQALSDYFFKHLPNISLFLQICRHERCNKKVTPFILLYGKPYIMETLNGFKFKISPGTRFPINKLGSELLYDTIVRTAKLKPNTTVLDICSGAGYNSIVFSKFVREAFGFESVMAAVTDAKYTANINNIHNVKFMSGGINSQLNYVLKRLNASSDAVAILNHRNNGVGLEIIKAIRNSLKISRILYFFYKSKGRNIIQKFIDLCSYRFSKLRPFKLTKVIPFDLLPQTAYVELILMFER